jgi:hypothetical protein
MQKNFKMRSFLKRKLAICYSGEQIKENRTSGSVARVVQQRNANGVLVGKREGKRPLGRSMRRWENNIKMDLQEKGREGVNWIDPVQDRESWQALMNKVLNCRVP